VYSRRLDTENKKKKGKGGTTGPTKDRIMTKDETEDCADKKANKTDD